jgi:hypothetical protein
VDQVTVTEDASGVIVRADPLTVHAVDGLHATVT